MTTLPSHSDSWMTNTSNIDHFQQAVHISLDPLASVSMKTQAVSFCEQLKSSPDGWRECLQFLSKSSLTTPEARFFAMQVLEDTFKRKIGSLDIADVLFLKNNLLVCMEGPLFDRLLAEPLYLKNKFAQLLVICFKHTFLTHWSAFFEDIYRIFLEMRPLSNMSADFFLRICRAIDDEIVNKYISRTTGEIQMNTSLKDTVRVVAASLLADCWYLILNEFGVISLNRDVVCSCLSVIGLYVSWMDIQLLVSPRFISLFHSFLNIPDVKTATCLCIKDIISKGMRPLDKLALLQSLQLLQFAAEASSFSLVPGTAPGDLLRQLPDTHTLLQQCSTFSSPLPSESSSPLPDHEFMTAIVELLSVIGIDACFVTNELTNALRVPVEAMTPDWRLQFSSATSEFALWDATQFQSMLSDQRVASSALVVQSVTLSLYLLSNQVISSNTHLSLRLLDFTGQFLNLIKTERKLQQKAPSDIHMSLLDCLTNVLLARTKITTEDEQEYCLGDSEHHGKGYEDSANNEEEDDNSDSDGEEDDNLQEEADGDMNHGGLQSADGIHPIDQQYIKNEQEQFSSNVDVASIDMHESETIPRRRVIESQLTLMATLHYDLVSSRLFDTCCHMSDQWMANVSAHHSSLPVNWRQIEHMIYLVSLYGHMLKPSPTFAKEPLSENERRLMTLLLEKCVLLIQYPHARVRLFYLDCLMRYSRAFEFQSSDVLKAVLGSGLVPALIDIPREYPNKSKILWRRRCIQTLLKIVKTVKSSHITPMAAPLLSNAMEALFWQRNLMLTKATVKSSSSQSGKPRRRKKSTSFLSSPSAFLYFTLLELSGELIRLLGNSDDEVSALRTILDPLVLHMQQTLQHHEKNSSCSTDMAQTSECQHTLILQLDILSLAQLAKCFPDTANVNLSLMFMQAFENVLMIASSMPNSTSVKEATRRCFHRLSSCLGERVLPMLPRVVSILLSSATNISDEHSRCFNDARAMIAMVPLVNQLMIRFRDRGIVDPMDQFFAPFCQRFFVILNQTALLCQKTKETQGTTSVSSLTATIACQYSELKRSFLSFIFTLVSAKVHPVLFAEKNGLMAVLEASLHCMRDRSTREEDDLQAQKLGMSLMTKWMDAWFVAQYASQPAISVFVSFLHEHILPCFLLDLPLRKYALTQASHGSDKNDLAAFLKMFMTKRSASRQESVEYLRVCLQKHWPPALVDVFSQSILALDGKSPRLFLKEFYESNQLDAYRH